MEKKLEVAQVVKPQGIKGEIKLKSLGSDPSELLEVDEIYFSGDLDTIRKVTKSWRYKDSIFMAIEGVTTRNDAEELRGEKVLIDSGQAKELEEGEYYIADLIGCTIIDSEGKNLGELKEILQHGAADVYVVKGEKSFMMPALKRVILRTDIDRKEILVDAQVLAEVIVYED